MDKEQAAMARLKARQALRARQRQRKRLQDARKMLGDYKKPQF